MSAAACAKIILCAGNNRATSGELDSIADAITTDFGALVYDGDEFDKLIERIEKAQKAQSRAVEAAKAYLQAITDG